MGRQSIITAFDKKNAHILENEIDRIWSAIEKVKVSAVAVAEPVIVPTETMGGGSSSGIAPETTLSGLTATVLVTSVILKWTSPTDTSLFDSIEIWRSNTNDRSAAAKVASVSINESSYWDNLGSAGLTRYYWIRTSSQGFPGPWVPSGSAAGVSATTAISSEAFPIGSIFIAIVSTSPATLLGYGTWTKIGQGRLILGQIGGVFDIADLLVYAWKRTA